jgi:hypothetical protein
VADATAMALAGKGKRVIGVFTLMIGAGLILESAAVWVGGLIALTGTLVFVWGIIEAHAGASATAAARETVESHA